MALAQTAETPAIKAISRLVTVDVAVTDERTGLRVEDLRQSDFKVFDNGRSQQIVFFSGKDSLQPIYLLLLIDMRSTTKTEIPYIKEALAPALQKLRPQDEVSVMDFGTGAEMVLPFTTDRQEVLDAIATIEQRQRDRLAKRSHRDREHERVYRGQGEDIAACLQAGIQHTHERRPNGRPVFLLFSDDLNAPPRHVVMDTTKILLKESATVNGLIKVSSKLAAVFKPISGLSRFDQGHNIEYYSQQTGGEAMNIQEHSYGAALEKVVGDIVGRYSLAFVPSNTDRRFHKLAVKVSPSSPDSSGNLRVRARRGYWLKDAD
ncbi:MAG TPA: VWA domain-containing protein [Candidatus Angelobacter sp.]|nr:VWA domain-containing protein [Candidatus Angelobacter sp.]